MKITIGMRIYISSSTSIDISAGDDIPEELLDKVPKVFRTTAVEYDKRIVMGNIRATNDLEISYSSSGIVIIKKGDIIPEELLDKVPKVFRTTGVIPPSPSVEKNAEDIAKNKIAIDTNKTDIAELDINATKMTTTATATVGVDGEEHWITIASTYGHTRHQGKVIASSHSDGSHASIEIDWMRSYRDAPFTILNSSAYTRCITGVRVIMDSDNAYGYKLLQIRSERHLNLTVQVIANTSNTAWIAPIAVEPIVEDTKTGFSLWKELTGIKYLCFGTSSGVKFKGDVYTDGHFYDNGKLVGLDKAKCFVDITAGDFSGDKDTYGRIVIGNIKYQTPGNNFTVDATTNEIIVNKEGYYNVEVVLNHSKGASTSVFSNARIQKNSNTTLASGSSGNTDGCSFSLVIRALGEKLSVGDKICIESNGKNDSSPWSTFSIEEV